MLDPDQLDQIAKLHWQAKSIVQGLHVGRHRSPNKGFGAEFKEHRPYVQGDETRDIDWKLYGKTDRLFIRQHEVETNLRCTLVVDQSRSMNYPKEHPSRPSKFAYSIQLSAALAYLFIHQQDSVGLTLVDSKVQSTIPPRSTPSHLQRILTHLNEAQAEQQDTSLAKALQEFAKQNLTRGTIIILSDFFDELDPLKFALNYLRQLRNEVVLFRVWDRDEVEFPFQKRIQFRSLETPEQQRTIDCNSFRRTYQKHVQVFLDELSKSCLENRIELVSCTTDQSPGDVLADFLNRRSRR